MEDAKPIIEYKCPGCAGALVFDSATQKMKCGHCDTEYSVEQLETFYEEHDNVDVSQDDWDSYKEQMMDDCEAFICPSCGAQILTDAVTAATQCIYCGSPAIVMERVSGVIRPDSIVPFKLDKNVAKATLRKFYKGKPLLPKSFANEENICKVTGLYVPFWLYDCGVCGTVTFDAKQVSTWCDSVYLYTKTDRYIVTREGNIKFSRIPADGSSKMSNTYMDAIEPFHYSELKEFSTAYLSGYLADKFDVGASENLTRVNSRIQNSTLDAFRSTVMGYDTVGLKKVCMHVDKSTISYAMMPVWVLNTKYKGSMYMFAMNGQTGKLVGKLPVDKKRYWAWLLGLTTAICALSQLLLLVLL